MTVDKLQFEHLNLKMYERIRFMESRLNDECENVAQK